MGREIEKAAHERGHEIVATFTSAEPPSIEMLRWADAAIEFTRPEMALQHIHMCHAAGIPLVVGTTGWYEHMEDVRHLYRHEGALLTATNFSIGVNITFYLNTVLARIMNSYPAYAAGITEVHHTRKLDAPSGTAITLANGLTGVHNAFSGWELSDEEIQSFGGKLPIKAIREDDVPGTHTVLWNSEIDSISLTHTAHNRRGFASGAVMAAEWLIGKSGIYGMADMLNFDTNLR